MVVRVSAQNGAFQPVSLADPGFKFVRSSPHHLFQL